MLLFLFYSVFMMSWPPGKCVGMTPRSAEGLPFDSSAQTIWKMLVVFGLVAERLV